MIRVLVVEDSATVRQVLVELLEADPGVTVVGEAATGREAVRLALRLRPDLITMDVHMPDMDGLEATKEVMYRSPTPIIVISSAADPADASLSLDAMRAGALMVMGKPQLGEPEQMEAFRAELLGMVKAMASVKLVRRWRDGSRTRGHTAARAPAQSPPELIAIAASTGGPAALQRILMDLPRDFPVPIAVVQHIAHGFVPGLCRWLSESTDLRVTMACHGEAMAPRTVYLAPDDRHLCVDGERRLALSGSPPIGGFRPSATALFQSAARVFGPRLTAVILTGMGRDGVEGLRAVRERGGRVLAQDRESSIVYGMPGEAAEQGMVDDVLPLDGIAARLIHLTGSV